MNIGTNVHRLRKERLMSQSALADAIGVHQTHISFIEQNRKTPSIQVAMRLAEYFGVPLGELLGESSELEPA